MGKSYGVVIFSSRLDGGVIYVDVARGMGDYHNGEEFHLGYMSRWCKRVGHC